MKTISMATEKPLLLLPITEKRPEEIRVMPSSPSIGVMLFLVQVKRPGTDKWITVSERRSFDQAEKEARDWYPS